jgi:hypothetical protein
VEGPATLVGPAVYESDFYKRMEKEGTLYIDMPVSNVIRSNGEEGIIKVSVFSEGIRMGEISIEATATKASDNGIYQPKLPVHGRGKVKQNRKEKKQLLQE